MGNGVPQVRTLNLGHPVRSANMRRWILRKQKWSDYFFWGRYFFSIEAMTT
jgi:hypothetical protein